MADPKQKSRLALPFFLNLFFTVFEILGGFYTGSVAILADAVHDLGDSIAIGLAWLLDVKARQKPDAAYTYGYGRYALLGGMIASLILVAGAAGVIAKAVPRLLNPTPVDATGMIVLAVIGVIVNGAAALNASKGTSLNEKAVGLHLFEDVFGWIAVLFGAIAMKLWNIPILDALLSLLFTVYILFHVFKNLRALLSVFLERSPRGFHPETITLAAVDGKDVLSVHHVHLWTVDGTNPLATLHAVVRSDAGATELERIRLDIHERLEAAGVRHATIEIELGDGLCEDPECAPDAPDAEGHHHHH
ncbi:MAG TPA: cation transporter [Acholeplasmatales bacterium]|nr:MAG: hypothetical protein A2Y16_03665 [Tenericutes bacterium GWF2_57_13]HAQ56183.1 cation transporter [Acholeplasmatales bacterium]